LLRFMISTKTDKFSIPHYKEGCTKKTNNNMIVRKKIYY
jgi:hypothetical protein